MAEAVIGIAGKIVSILGSQAIETVGKLWGVKHELKALRDTVSMLQPVLNHAKEQYHQTPHVRVWVEELKDAFYEAQDVLEELNIEAIRRELRGYNEMIKEVRTFFSSSNQLAFKLKMSNKVRAVRERIQAIKAEKKFHLDERGVDSQIEREWRKREETHSFIREGDIIGRDDDKKKVKHFLLDTNVKEDVSILPIVGVGGLGKTALAQCVYNDEMVRKQFNLKMWVCVSDNFDMKKIVKDIIACAKKKEPTEVAMDRLQSELRGEIDGKRYLLVLDDLWNAERETWLSFKTLFLGGARGSKILITTRIPLVAEIAGTASSHLLKGLSEGASLDLLMQMASREEKQDSDMLAIGKEIVKKCSGVPLVVRTVGSLLFFKKTKHEWLHFKEYELPDVSQRCWGMEKESMSEADLCQLIQSFKRLRILDLHEIHFEKVPRSICKLKHLTYLDLSCNGKIKRLPDAITRLQNLQTLNLRSYNSLEELPRGIRKLVSLRNLDIDGCRKLSYMPRRLGQLSSLHKLTRFIFPKNKAVAKNCCELGELNGLNNVRGSLCIENLGSVTDAVAESTVANLTGKRSLEYLALEWGSPETNDDAIAKDRDETLLDGLQPPSNLRKLRINGYKGERFPRWMMYSLASSLPNLVELRLLHCRRCKRIGQLGQLPRLKTLEIQALTELECLPEEECLKSLVSLESLSIGHCLRLTSLSRGMRHLSNLKRLSFWDCRELDISREESGNIISLDGSHGGGLVHSLRSLYIGGLPKLQSLPQWLLQLTYLERLDIIHCDNLKELPEGIRRLASLTHLKIVRCLDLELDICKDERSGSIIFLDDSHGGGLLHNLRFVEISWLPKPESLPQWLLQASKLERLHISYCYNLKELPEQIEAFQSLQQLHISCCDSLTSLPKGVRRLASLTQLIIAYCRELELDLSKDENGSIILDDIHGGLLHRLHFVQIGGLPKLESHPRWLLQLTNLEHLDIYECDNLKELPERVEALQSLQWLTIHHCPSETSLPEGMRRLQSLARLDIFRCPVLEERCKRDAGEDWYKIAHIPHISLS